MGYTVVEDHEFVAQWEKKESQVNPTPDKKAPKDKTRTGDETKVIPWIMMILLSSVLAILLKLRRSLVNR